MNRFVLVQCSLVIVLNLWFGVAFAHLEPVRVLASFPTAASSQVRVNLLGSESGSAVTGAIIDLEIKAFGSSDPAQIIKFKEVLPGRYEASLSVAPGSYQLGIVDRTFPQEALRYSFKGDLPRPANLNIASWVWAATKPNPTPTTNAPMIVVLGLPVLITLLSVVFISLRTRSKPRASTDKNT
jgi:hypothetical protein